MENSTDRILQLVAQTLYDKKAFNILILDVRGICSMTDYFIIAEGNVDRHVKALLDSVEDVLAKEKLFPLRTEGTKSSDWVVLDYGDFMIHLFTSELREAYSLERVWKAGKIVDVKFKQEKHE